MKRISVWLMLVVMALPFSRASAVTIDMVDDFEDGTTMGWRKGFNSAPKNKPTLVQEANANHYLKNQSIGGEEGGHDSQLTIHNTSLWRGNYNTAGIGSVQARMVNLGDEDLYMRLAFSSFVGDNWHFYASKEALVLPADTQWYDLSFGISEEDIAIFPGGEDTDYDAQWSVEDGVAAVRKLKFVNAKEGALFWGGDNVVATMGLDDIRGSSEVLHSISLSTSAAADVAPVPLPASAWLLVTGLLGLVKISTTKRQ